MPTQRVCEFKLCINIGFDIMINHRVDPGWVEISRQCPSDTDAEAFLQFCTTSFTVVHIDEPRLVRLIATVAERKASVRVCKQSGFPQGASPVNFGKIGNETSKIIVTRLSSIFWVSGEITGPNGAWMRSQGSPSPFFLKTPHIWMTCFKVKKINT